MNREVIDQLISCPKVINHPPRKTMGQDPRNSYTMRNDFTCLSVDGKHQFSVFIRFNTVIPYIFSIGLKYKGEDGEMIICRYNGKHTHRNKVTDTNRLDDFHIHKLLDQQLTDGTSDSIDAEPTNRYVSFPEALCMFLCDCNVSGWELFFPDIELQATQTRLDGV